MTGCKLGCVHGEMNIGLVFEIGQSNFNSSRILTIDVLVFLLVFLNSVEFPVFCIPSYKDLRSCHIEILVLLNSPK